MGRDDWWHNTSWNEDIEAAFFDKFARARNKSFYLRSQARFLASSHPEVALRLLDQYFALGADLCEAEAHFYRARAHVALRSVDAAVIAFEAALAREDAVPNFRTWAFHELPVLIATERMSAHYDRAIQVLMKHRNWLTFPVQRYQWHGALALILHEQGQTLEAANEARQALEAAKMTDSGSISPESRSGGRYRGRVRQTSQRNRGQAAFRSSMVAEEMTMVMAIGVSRCVARSRRRIFVLGLWL